jgi:prophage DNA circulation protein
MIVYSKSILHLRPLKTNLYKKMKKVLFTLLVGGMSLFYGCGSNDQQKADQAKAAADSVAKATEQAASAMVAKSDTMPKAAVDTTSKMNTPVKK